MVRSLLALADASSLRTNLYRALLLISFMEVSAADLNSGEDSNDMM